VPAAEGIPFERIIYQAKSALYARLDVSHPCSRHRKERAMPIKKLFTVEQKRENL
jgi:hypothetical protein